MPRPGVTDVKQRPKPVVLLILDGWGLSPAWGGNAITTSDPPTFNYLWKHYPHAVLQAFRVIAGPSGIVGSSEIGHASIGAGRVVEQDLTEINLTIESGQFYENPTLKAAFAKAREQKKAVHLIGLLSEGGIHGSLRHAQALVEFAKREGVEQLWVHPFTDGRDVETTSALEPVKALEATLAVAGIGKIGTVIGRFYAMDRDSYWERTAAAYEALVYGVGQRASSIEEAITNAYRAGLDDEHIPPTIVGGSSSSHDPSSKAGQKSGQYVPGRIQPGDVVVHWNFRADRGRQLVRALLDKRVFRQFLVSRRYPLLPDLTVVTMTDFHLQLPNLAVAFPSAAIDPTLGSLLANHQFTQLHVAESEKYAHVTYFLNGGREEPYQGEDRTIVPSPRVASYDTVPAMSAGAITRVLERAITKKSHDFIVANYANVDMVAHTGNLHATGQAVLVVDEAIRRVANAVMDAGGALVITADHGNAESVVTLKQGDRETMHTLNPVPFLYVAPGVKRSAAAPAPQTSLVREIMASPHTLGDVAPTILELFGIAKPSDMTGQSLFDTLE
ncbi:2,3-bisphosphoglycerate-independent phosphoglycerate mutase [Candidatus Berkelbacteria bacterium]|nr:2,3-bisphosphoglycerate-independent phosphoglycerate mutase [Candidatus Berkelbacteria bacterium]